MNLNNFKRIEYFYYFLQFQESDKAIILSHPWSNKFFSNNFGECHTPETSCSVWSNSKFRLSISGEMFLFDEYTKKSWVRLGSRNPSSYFFPEKHSLKGAYCIWKPFQPTKTPRLVWNMTGITIYLTLIPFDLLVCFPFSSKLILYQHSCWSLIE